MVIPEAVSREVPEIAGRIVEKNVPISPRPELTPITPVSFGSVAVGVASPPTQTLTFTITAGGTIAAPLVMTRGATGKDFTDNGTGTCTTNGTSHSYAANATCTVVVKFNPLAPGFRQGGVELTNTAGTTVVATGLISGTGTSPLATFASNTTLIPIGSGFAGAAGVEMDGKGDIFVADFTANVVKEIVAVNGVVSASSTVNTIVSGLNGPSGLWVDGLGDVFFTDVNNNAVKEVVAVNGSVSSSSTVNTIGDASTGFSEPYDVTVDGNGNVFVANSGVNQVDEIVAVNGAVSKSSTIVNLASSYDFNQPQSVSVDSNGDVFAGSYYGSVVYEIVASGGTVSGSSTVRTVASGFQSDGVSADAAGDVYVVDEQNNVLKEILAVNGTIPSSPTILTVASFDSPGNVGQDGYGRLFVSDLTTTVKEIDRRTPPTLTFADTALGSTSASQTITLQNAGNTTLSFPIPGSGTNPTTDADFTVSNSSTCPQLTTSTFSAGSLAESAICTYTVAYAPVTNSAVVEDMTLTDTDLNVTSTQSVANVGSPGGLSVQVVDESAAYSGSTASTTLEFIVGYGGSTAPTSTPTLTVNGSATGVGAITCTTKTGHKNCTASYSTTTLTAGNYTIMATQPASGSYSTTTGSGTLTVTGVP